MSSESENAIHHAAHLLRCEDPNAEITLTWVRELFSYSLNGYSVEHSPAKRSTIVIDAETEELRPYWEAIMAVHRERADRHP